MKKIPCLFVRVFAPRLGGRGQDFVITPKVTPGLEWVLAGQGIATRKYDGTACMVKDGVLYKRYDVKEGKTPPPDAIACDVADTTTGHRPHWLPVGDEPGSKWHKAAWGRRTGGADTILQMSVLDGLSLPLPSGTYELCGPHFQGNPEKFDFDVFVPHGKWDLGPIVRTFEGIRSFLKATPIEGIVFLARRRAPMQDSPR